MAAAAGGLASALGPVRPAVFAATGGGASAAACDAVQAAPAADQGRGGGELATQQPVGGTPGDAVGWHGSAWGCIVARHASRPGDRRHPRGGHRARGGGRPGEPGPAKGRESRSPNTNANGEPRDASAGDGPKEVAGASGTTERRGRWRDGAQRANWATQIIISIYVAVHIPTSRRKNLDPTLLHQPPLYSNGHPTVSTAPGLLYFLFW